jgi:serine/threonine protein kinase/Tol biopolymer transport system component
VALTPGTRLGPYEVTATIGSGGMGHVYRAKDTRLGREVAVKISGERFTDRFEREAHAIAALNHPNICTLYDVGPDYLVMELIDGLTLADRMQQGPIPSDETLAIAAQIASALEAAHASGVTHRDLKPGNVKIRPDGTVKVLDFGLAKLGRDDQAAEGEDLANSPTKLETATRVGTILGTAGYMAPEQATGKPADKRADIWAFGVVVWEMLTGRRLFGGESAADVIAAVLTKEPAWDAVPPRFQFVLRRCLEKDPKRRLHDIADARLLLEEPPIVHDRPSPPGLHRWLPWTLGALGALVAVALATTLLNPPTAVGSEGPPVVFELPAPRGTQYSGGAFAEISPDGRHLAFTAAGSSGALLWLRALDSLEARPITTAANEGVNSPSWSPDSKSIIYRTQGGATVKRVDIAGGAPEPLAASLKSIALGGAAWRDDGMLLFATVTGVYRTSVSGDSPERVIEPDPSRQELGFGFPQFLPDGRFLFLIQSTNPNTEGLYVGSLGRPAERVKILSTSDRAVYVPPYGGWPGYLLFLRNQSLMAQRFDAPTLSLEGDPVRIVDGLSPSTANAMAFSVSMAGPLVYRTGGVDAGRKLTWISRSGARAEAAPPGFYQSLRLSPDGKDVAFDAVNGVEDVWRFEFTRGVRTRLTAGGRRDVVPVWSPDGSQFAFMSDRTGIFQLYRKDARGGGAEEQLTEGPSSKYATDWNKNGYLLYYEIDSTMRDDLWAVPVDGNRKPVEVLRTPARERNGVFSPDGKWIAYASDESGREEVYIQPFPATGFKWAVSNQGGNRPKWRGDQKELFYLEPSRNSVMAADVRIAGNQIETGAPHELFTLSWPLPELVAPYDVSPDGRFLVLDSADPLKSSAALVVMLNWRAGLPK